MTTIYPPSKVLQLSKGNGRKRTIVVPNLGFFYRLFLSRVGSVFSDILEATPGVDHVHGFRRLRSPVTNALAHVGKQWTVSMDLQDFFPSVKYSVVRSLVAGLPEETRKAIVKNTILLPTVHLIASELVHAGELPQGYASSPSIANLAALPMDWSIMAALRAIDPAVVYTRYADDLTISTDDGGLAKVVPSLVAAQAVASGFVVAAGKTHIMWAGAGRRKVCGVAVGDTGVYPTRSLRRSLRVLDHRVASGGNERVVNRRNGLKEWSRLRLPVIGKRGRTTVESIASAIKTGSPDQIAVAEFVGQSRHSVEVYEEIKRRVVNVAFGKEGED